VEPRLILEVRWGKMGGHKAVLEPGKTLRVGRTDFADLELAHDAELSKIHFEISWDGARSTFKDLNTPSGTFLNGEARREGEVRHGSWIRAGQTIFSVFHEAKTPPPRPSFEGPGEESLSDEQRAQRALARRDEEERRQKAQEALALLERASGDAPLHMIVDAARGRRILTLLHESVDEAQSLYDGAQGEDLEEAAPYLVRFARGSGLLERMVMEGWGKRWGVYLTSALPFKDLRRHLRRFLMVELESTGEPVYFRFYDPGVLRTFLPSCAEGQRGEFMGEISSFIAESRERTPLVFFRFPRASSPHGSEE